MFRCSIATHCSHLVVCFGTALYYRRTCVDSAPLSQTCHPTRQVMAPPHQPVHLLSRWTLRGQAWCRQRLLGGRTFGRGCKLQPHHKGSNKQVVNRSWTLVANCWEAIESKPASAAAQHPGTSSTPCASPLAALGRPPAPQTNACNKNRTKHTFDARLVESPSRGWIWKWNGGQVTHQGERQHQQRCHQGVPQSLFLGVSGPRRAGSGCHTNVQRWPWSHWGS